MSHDQTASPLDDLSDAIEAVREAPAAVPTPPELVERLRSAARAARQAGYPDEANERLHGAFEGASDPAGLTLLMAMLARNDGEFESHTIPELTIRRVEFTGYPVPVDELGIELVETTAGSLVPRVTTADQTPLITVATEIQLFVLNELPEDEAARLHQRGFDYSHLKGELLTAQYGFRTLRRIAWGVGICLVTDSRLIGLIFDNDVGIRSPEHAAMPLAAIGTKRSSVLVFICQREVFDELELINPGPLLKRIPYVNLGGNCSVALETMRVYNPQSDLLERPGKHVIANVFEEFVNGRQ